MNWKGENSMKKKRIALIVLTFVLMLTSTTTAFAAVPEDVKDTYYEKAVTTLFDKGIVLGDIDGLFHPDAFLTRAQACIMVVKAMNAPETELIGAETQKVTDGVFKDLAGYSWAEDYINYAVRHGVVSGYPDGTFKPGNQLTMYELLTMVVRAAGYGEGQVTGTWPTNYYSKAIELEILGGIAAPLPEKTRKYMAAYVLYDALALIERANLVPQIVGESIKFTARELGSAMKIVENYFAFPASTLTRIWYNEEKSNSSIESYLKSGKGSINGAKAEDVIVILSNFDVDESGDNPVLNPGSTYKNYQWILIRDSKTSDWRIDDWGY